jgi:hypothetical protein
MYGWIKKTSELITKKDRPDHALIQLYHPCTVYTEVVLNELGRVGVLAQISTVCLGASKEIERVDVIGSERT